ncbi:hypothetical protein DFQ27_004985 [Actinomortierella ambigua]|uniref:Uncharacterized protein n=1 Tax=Actinomortierella ambigua TaxID=1343610 RepID=A0A9P6UBC2_9FUNG|nr:hypothetical protein DFQ27_004985 [Actinomortierella ambigua]
MKFSIVAAVAACAAVASAQTIAISQPTKGSIWTVGEKAFIEWGNRCDGSGPAAQQVKIDLKTGDANNTRFVASLGTLDCSSKANSTRYEFLFQEDVQSGMYSLTIQTIPPSYTNPFEIVNKKSATPPPTASTPPAAEKPVPTGAASSMLVKTGSVAAAALAAAAYLF